MIFHIPKSAKQAAVTTVVLLFTFAANAQRVIGYPKNEITDAQIARVRDAVDRLAPFQVAGCWLRPQVSPLIEISPRGGKGLEVAVVTAEAGTSLSQVKPGDLLQLVDGEAIKADGFEGLRASGEARFKPSQRLLRNGRTFSETYKNAQDQLVSVANPVRLDCTASDVFIIDNKSDSAAMREIFGLGISSSRLSQLNDEQLLAFIVWNHAFMALRHETNADVWGIVTLLGNGNASNYEYSNSAHEKIDWVTLRTLRAMNANMNAYPAMLSAVEAFDKVAGFSLLGSKRFINRIYGGSPFGGEEKKIRLAAWVKLLEQDPQASRPASLQVSNALLFGPTWTAWTVPLPAFQTVEEALLPLLGEARAKDVAQRYMSALDMPQRKSESSTPSHLSGGVKPTPRFQMLYVHHVTKRLIWVSLPTPSHSDGNICVQSSDCSLLAVGPHVIARPSSAWAEELAVASGAYAIEEIN